MRATALEVNDTKAVVNLRPCWLARLLGAQETTVVLMWRERSDGHGWQAAGSRRWLDSLPHRSEIEDALDFWPVRMPKALLL